MRIAKPWFRAANQTWYVWHNGKQVNLGKDERKAKKAFQKLINRGRPGEGQTVRQVVAAYWTWATRNLAQSTCDRRKPLLDSFSAFIEEKTPTLVADALKPFHVQRWIDANQKVKVQRKTGDKRETIESGKDITKTTENTRIGLIKGVMSWAKAMGYVDENPISSMKRPAAAVRQDFIPSDLWPQVVKLARDEPFRDYLTVMLASGARPQEMRKVTAANLSGERFVFAIDDSKGKKKSRVVYLPAEALAIVQKLCKAHPEGPIFRNSKGNAWTNNSIRCRFRYFKKKLKMPNLCAMTLRHSYAHFRLSSGQDALTISKLMGHTDTKMLATRYGHLEENADYMKAAANGVAFPTLSDIVPGPPAAI